MGLPYMVGGKTHPRFLYEKPLSKPEPTAKKPLDYADEEAQFYARWLERESQEWKRDAELVSRGFNVSKETGLFSCIQSADPDIDLVDPYKPSLLAIKEFHQLIGPQTLRAHIIYTTQKITVQILWNKTKVKEEFVYGVDELPVMRDVYFGEYVGRIEEIRYTGLPVGHDLGAVYTFLRDLCPSWESKRESKSSQKAKTLECLAQLKAELSTRKRVEKKGSTKPEHSDKVKERLARIRSFGEEPLY